jgi:hypothetical protein
MSPAKCGVFISGTRREPLGTPRGLGLAAPITSARNTRRSALARAARNERLERRERELVQRVRNLELELRSRRDDVRQERS